MAQLASIRFVQHSIYLQRDDLEQTHHCSNLTPDPIFVVKISLLIPNYPIMPSKTPGRRRRSKLQQLMLQHRYYHRSGFQGRTESLGNLVVNIDLSVVLPVSPALDLLPRRSECLTFVDQ